MKKTCSGRFWGFKINIFSNFGSYRETTITYVYETALRKKHANFQRDLTSSSRNIWPRAAVRSHPTRWGDSVQPFKQLCLSKWRKFTMLCHPSHFASSVYPDIIAVLTSPVFFWHRNCMLISKTRRDPCYGCPEWDCFIYVWIYWLRKMWRMT